MRKIELIKKIAYAVIFATLLIVAVSLIAGRFGIGGIRTLVVKSGSMEPSIPTGSVVIVAPYNNYHEGDIVTFKHSGRESVLVTHRIQSIESTPNGNAFITKGDANEEADGEMVSPRDVVGKSIFSVPLVGKLIDFAQTQVGFILIIIIPAVAIVYSEILNIRKEIARFITNWRSKRIAKNIR